MQTVPCPKCGRAIDVDQRRCPHDGMEIDSSHVLAVASTINSEKRDATDDRAAAVIGMQLDKYVVDEIIGRGGMGTVFRAHHAELGHKVALKVMDQRIVGSGDAHTRFLREAKAVAKISHDNVVRVLDYARHPIIGSFMVMELLNGTSLDVLLSQDKRLPEARAIDIALQVCDALHAAHDLGIVHRDLKPANVFLTKTAGVELVKVMDFGVAKVATDGGTLLTRPGSVIGTPLYMSPEQWDNVPVDARSDVYSFGVVFYEMLTGQLPIRGSAITEVAKNVALVKPTAPREIRPELSAAVAEIAMRCLEKNRDDRFASMAEVAEALREARAGARSEAPAAAPRSTWVAIGLVVVAAAGIAVYLKSRPAGGDPIAPKPAVAVEAGGVVEPAAQLPTAAVTTLPTPSVGAAATTSPVVDAGAASAQAAKPPVAKPTAAPTTRPIARPTGKREDNELFGN